MANAITGFRIYRKDTAFATPPGTVEGTLIATITQKTTTQASFIVPAKGANVTVQVTTSSWMTVGNNVNVLFGGHYKIMSVPNGTSVVLRYEDIATNVHTNATIGSGSDVTNAAFNDTTTPNPNWFYRQIIDTSGGQTYEQNDVQIYAGPPTTLHWLRNIFQTEGVNYQYVFANGVAADRQGNIIVVGTFGGSVNLGDGVTRTAVEGKDGFIVKYSSTGVVLWAKTFGGSGDDVAYGVAVDSAGNVIVTGYINSSVNFGGGPLPNLGGHDIFVVKYSSAGSHIWSHSYGDQYVYGDDWGSAVAVDASDNVFIGGVVGPYPVNFGGGDIAGLGSQNTFVLKLNSAGAYIWAKRLPGGGFGDGNSLNSIAVDRAGDVLIAGYVTGQINFGTGLQSANGAFFAKYSGATGAYQWARAIGSGSASGVATDPINGDVVFTGSFTGSANFGTGTVSTSGGGAIFVVRYTATGTQVWLNVYGGLPGASDNGSSVAIDSVGRIGVTGQVQSAVDFGGGYLYGSGLNFFALTLTSSGQYLWAKRVVSAIGHAVAFDSSSNMVTTGWVTDTVDFGGGPVSFSVPAQHGFAVWYGA